MVGIAPVAPDRIPEPLPEGLNLPLVITVQTDGPANFDRPAPVVFPNVPDPETGEILPPGSKSALWSFNHDTGLWEIGGPMTVSSDGLWITSDPGVGIRQPGWHGSRPGTSNRGGGGRPGGGGPDGPPDDDDCNDPDGCEEDDDPDPDPDDPDPDDDEKDCKTEAGLALSGIIQAQVAVATSVPRAIPGAGPEMTAVINGLAAQADSMIAPEQSGDFWEGAARNSVIATAGFIPNPYVSGAATYVGLLDTFSSLGDRLGALAGCAAPLPLNLEYDWDSVLSPGSLNRDEAKRQAIETLRIITASFDSSKFPMLAKMPRYLEIQFDYLQAAYDYYVAFYGSDVWLRQGLEQSDAVDAYIKLIFSKLVDNFAIGETEKNDILNSSIRPSGITDTDVNNLIDLLNDRSANGLSESDFNTIKSRIGTMTKMLQAIFDETPYDHPYFFGTTTWPLCGGKCSLPLQILHCSTPKGPRTTVAEAAERDPAAAEVPEPT
jgi:hypothetical protein